MKKLYLTLQLSVVTQDEADINHMMEHTIKDTIIKSLNRIYSTGSFFELLGYSVEDSINIRKQNNNNNNEGRPGPIKEIKDIGKYNISDSISRLGENEEARNYCGTLKDPEDNLLIDAKCSHCNRTFSRKGPLTYIQKYYCDICINDGKT